MDFFAKSKMGNILGSLIIHGFFYVCIKLSYELGLYKKMFRDIFGVANYTKTIDFKSFIGNLIKLINEFSIRYWLEEYVYRFSLISIIVSLILTIIFILMYSTRPSGNDMKSTWNVFAVILLAILIIGGVAFTPIVNSGLLIWSYINYIIVGFLPFYFSTFLFCGVTAFKSYEAKRRFNAN